MFSVDLKKKRYQHSPTPPQLIESVSLALISLKRREATGGIPLIVESTVSLKCRLDSSVSNWSVTCVIFHRLPGEHAPANVTPKSTRKQRPPTLSLFALRYVVTSAVKSQSRCELAWRTNGIKIVPPPSKSDSCSLRRR